MEGGWLLLGMPWATPVQGTERRGEPVLDVTPCPCVEPTQGCPDTELLCLCPFLALKCSHMPCSAPSLLSRVECCQVIGKLGSKGWTGETETVEELLEPGPLGCRTHCLLQWGTMSSKLLDLPFFPARFSL